MKIASWILLLLTLAVIPCSAQSGRIHTQPDPFSLGGIEGSLGTPLVMAVAVDRERMHVFESELANGDSTFRFAHLPVAKYDIVCQTKDGILCEGLALGEPPSLLTGTSRANLDTRIAAADAFFNRHVVHRIGVIGRDAFALVERIRDNPTLKQSGEKLDGNIRRIEIIEFTQAADDWQMVRTRHIYRETEPIRSGAPFFKHAYIPELGSIRVVDSMKSLGTIPIPPTP